MRCRRLICPIETQRRAPDLAHTLGELVGGGEDLVALLIQHQMVVAEVRAGYMPVKVLGLEIEREHVRQQRRQCARDVTDRIEARSVGVASGPCGVLLLWLWLWL